MTAMVSELYRECESAPARAGAASSLARFVAIRHAMLTHSRWPRRWPEAPRVLRARPVLGKRKQLVKSRLRSDVATLI